MLCFDWLDLFIAKKWIAKGSSKVYPYPSCSLCRWRHHKGPSRKWGSFVLSTLWMLEWCYGECMTHVRQLQVPWNFFRCNTPLKYFTYNHTIFYVRDFRRRGESVTFCDSPRLTAILGTPWGILLVGGPEQGLFIHQWSGKRASNLLAFVLCWPILPVVATLGMRLQNWRKSLQTFGEKCLIYIFVKAHLVESR